LWSDGIEVDQNRLFPPKKLVDICENDDVQFYCLQKNNNSVQLPEHIQDLQHLLISWEDVVACVHNLDLVITTNTHIAHISSAMGKPTWVIVPTVPQPVWAHGDEHSPWYQKTTRVFRQKKYGEWDDVFDDIKSKLKNI
jgi:ADP-heptose:LPS heptosyltransferase